MSLVVTSGQPYVTLRNVTVNDPPPGGNGNNHFEPGESGNILTTIKNIGGVEAQNVTAILRSGNSLFVITDSTTTFGNMVPGNEQTNTQDPFAATAGGTIEPGTMVPCTLFVRSDNWSHDWAFPITFEVGKAPLPPGTIIWGPKVCPSMPTSYGLYGLAYDTEDDRIYCTYFFNSTIYVYSSDSLLTFIGTLPAPEDSCTDIDYCAYDNTFWVMANPRKTVYKITPTGTVLRQFTVPAVDYPVGLVENDAEHKLYITDRRQTLGAQQRIFVTDTLGNVLSTVNHPKNGSYGSRCLALDQGTPSSPPSLLNMYTWFNSGGTAIDSCVLYELDREWFLVLHSFKFADATWNMRGIEYDWRDGSYWVTIMQTTGGTNNLILKIAGFNPPPQVGMAEQQPVPGRGAGSMLLARPNPFARATTISLAPGMAAPAELRIYDNNGRLVRSLTADRSVVWDGRNQIGQAVTPGIYFCGVAGDSKTWTKVVLSR